MVIERGACVTLNDAEQRLAKYLAMHRQGINRAEGIKNLKVGPQDALAIDLEGVASEIAFCRMANVFPDTSLSPRRGGHDCVLRNGQTVDVKQTAYPSGRLITMPSKSASAADIYVLMVGTFATYTFGGWAYSDELLNYASLMTLGHGPTYAIAQDKLHRALDVASFIDDRELPF